MIELEIDNKKSLLIFNNRVFKDLRGLTGFDIINNMDIDKLDDPDFVIELGYLAYCEGCKYRGITPIEKVKFGSLIDVKLSWEITEAFGAEIIKVSDFLQTKKKMIQPEEV